MISLHQKHTLPAPTDISTSPTEQRIGLEKAEHATLLKLREELVAADQAIKNHSAMRELEAERLTAHTMLTVEDLHAFVEVGYLKILPTDPYRGTKPATSVDGVYRLEMSSYDAARDAAEIMANRGLKRIAERRITANVFAWIVFDPAVTSEEIIREKVRAGHLAQLDAKAESLPAKLKEAKQQFELFKKHAESRYKEISDFAELRKSPLL